MSINMNPLFDLLTKSELALELDASIAELNAKQARIDAQAERIKALEAALKLADEDLHLWHDEQGAYQTRDGDISYRRCEGCSTCEETFPLIDSVLQKGGGNG